MTKGCTHRNTETHTRHRQTDTNTKIHYNVHTYNYTHACTCTHKYIIITYTGYSNCTVLNYCVIKPAYSIAIKTHGGEPFGQPKYNITLKLSYAKHTCYFNTASPEGILI